MFNNSQNQIFQYNGSPITFQKGDSVMVNATEMAKPFGKRCNDFLSSKSTKELIVSLSAKTGISATGLVSVNQGGNNQGTWLHEDLALIFAQWLSPDFYLWCNDRIKELQKSAPKNNKFLFGSLRVCCTFAVLQIIIYYAQGIFYAQKASIFKIYREVVSVYHSLWRMIVCSKIGYDFSFFINNK